ncbi:MAG: hypothetical protein IKZ92_01760 [Muribaculaceae bacterium]|nr:hypothetical protein [Muribaculaceae bacterium]
MKYRIDIVINLDDIQQAIYTEGQWHPAENATAWGVNSSNEPIVDRRVREGLEDLLARMSGYIVSKNINFNLDSQNIVLGLALDKRPLLSLASELKTAIITALANYTLMSLYGDEDSIYGTAWRLHRARTVLLLCRP